MTLRPPETFTEFLHLRFTRRLADGRSIKKLELDEIGAAVGVKPPEIYRTFENAADIDLSGLPDAFVVKPTFLSALRGVLVLHKIAGGQGYWCSITRRRVMPSEVVREMAFWETSTRKRRGGTPSSFIVQERVFGEQGNGIPFDYKIYTFNGTVKWIYVYDRNSLPPKLTFFRDNFAPFDVEAGIECSWKKAQAGVPVVPRCADGLLKAARAVSRHLATPFVRVDMYATSRGPVLGEITHTPGAVYFESTLKLKPEFDRELGAQWAKEAEALGVRVPLLDPEEQRRKVRLITAEKALKIGQKRNVRATTAAAPNKAANKATKAPHP